MTYSGSGGQSQLCRLSNGSYVQGLTVSGLKMIKLAVFPRDKISKSIPYSRQRVLYEGSRCSSTVRAYLTKVC